MPGHLRRGLRPEPSITRRLVLSLTLATVVMWCLGAGYASYASYRQVSAAFDAALRQTALRILPLAADDAISHEADDARDIARMMDGGAVHISYVLSDDSGKVLLRERGAPQIPFSNDRRPGFSTAHGYRIYSRRDPVKGLTITIVESMRDRRRALYDSITAMLGPLLLLVPLNILAIWLGVRGALRPIERLRADIAARDGRNLAPLDQSGQPRELRPIADAVARLIERLARALDAERALSANSAHELRTPIAGALAQTQRLLAETQDPPARARGQEIEATLKRLARLSDKLMQLARADAGIGLHTTPVDLKPIFDVVVMDTAAHWNAATRVQVAAGGVESLWAAMDPDAFALVLRNLLDNALAHGPRDGAVQVTLDPGGLLRVENGGPVLPAKVLATLTRRFARGRTGASGAGLGLAIVQTIVGQSGGALRLVSPAPGRSDGFAAEVQLPLVAAKALAKL
ncbi:hypothetical protein U879_09925 [Defluviimonas sp. 20V17]|uniref:histidine kinase n=1 Tax=Allgaiera indica TaxID=765699 RepID=A0AAN4UPX6_9RHOB|nr:HAMP domain-containing sensor histidine kinase [Allgaiera indica]KDB03867.1 hypothetical protein U879_09925 [Defluviimonas sp. 20V17]GHE00114.1 two-component sensor histidine kinase [Allgaiera indica]SDW36972.1 two-component system, OmpR family, sensor kinase [Allgaiera indica]